MTTFKITDKNHPLHGRTFEEYDKFERHHIYSANVTWIPLLIGANTVKFFALCNLEAVREALVLELTPEAAAHVNGSAHLTITVKPPMKYIVSVSGGLGSAEALKRTIDAHGKENVVAVFADVKGHGSTHFWSPFPIVDQLLHERFGGESTDTYRFLWQLAYHFDIPIVRLEDDRTIFSVMGKNGAFRLFSGGVFVHKCSEEKKRRAIKTFIQSNFKPGEYTIVLGMGYDEAHRVKASQGYWQRELGWNVEVIAPNAEKPLADTCVTEQWVTAAGLDIPSAYAEDFDHNNCNSGCIAAGQGHFANLYHKRPGVFHYWAWMEKSLQTYWGKPVTILKDERGGEAKPLSLYDFIPRILAGDYQKTDIGGCGCFVGNPMASVLLDAEIVAPPEKKPTEKPAPKVAAESLPLFTDTPAA